MKRVLASIAVFLLLINSAFATLEGPETCEAGTLATIRSDTIAVWAVYPQTYAGSFAVADGGKTLFFASPIKGDVAIIAASVSEDGKPVIDTLTLRNGMNAPDPAPESDLEQIIKTESAGKDANELTALAESFEAVVYNIDRRLITTTAGARETFRATWMAKGSNVKTTTLDSLSKLISAISAYIDNSSLEGLREGYARSAKALRAIINDKR